MENVNYLKLAKTFFYGGLVFSFITTLLFLTYSQNVRTETADVSAAVIAPANQDPNFGAVYKEFKLKWGTNNKAWRVNNPNAKREEAQALLPNPILNTDGLQYVSEPFNITEEDLNSDVDKVEIIIDRWGGHPGTKDEKFRINGNQWYNIPDVPTIPTDDPTEYLHHDHPKIIVNASDLKPGNNTFEGTTSDKSPSGWGQWGWTSMLIRVYYKEGTRTTVTGTIQSNNTLGENPTVSTQLSAPAGLIAQKVDYVAYYEGVDEDGDGYTTDWHEAYFSPKQFQGPGTFEIYGHVGTSMEPQNFPVVWNTRYVPDQQANSIKIFARIKSSNGLTYITEPKTGITLSRNDTSVKIYHAKNVPTSWSSRKNKTNDAVRVQIPAGTNLNNVDESAMFWRTWNGKEWEWGYNNYSTNFQAVNHGFNQSFYELPKSALKAGTGANDGVSWIRADTEEHAIEGVWPGPALIVRTGTSWPTVVTPTPIVTPDISPTPTLEITVTPTIESTVTPTVTLNPSVTVTPVADTPPASITPSIVPSTNPDVSICGPADSNGDGKFTIGDFIIFAGSYLKECTDTDVDYGICGGKDVNQSGSIGISDFVSFAARYAPRQSCQL